MLIFKGCVFVLPLPEGGGVPLVSDGPTVSSGSWSGPRHSHLQLFWGKLPRRNTFRAARTHGRRSGETVAIAEGFVDQNVSWLGGTARARRRNIGGAGATPRKRPSRAQTGHSKRSLPEIFLARRRGGLKGPRRGPPRAVVVHSAPSRLPVHSLNWPNKSPNSSLTDATAPSSVVRRYRTAFS